MDHLFCNPFSRKARTTDTQWRHKSKISEKLGRCGRQNILRPYLKIWEWEWIFGRAVKAISSLGVRSPWYIWLWKVFKFRKSYRKISLISDSTLRNIIVAVTLFWYLILLCIFNFQAFQNFLVDKSSTFPDIMLYTIPQWRQNLKVPSTVIWREKLGSR